MSYSDECQSTYCYKGTGVLINNFHIKAQQLLDKIDADITRKNLALLSVNPITGNFDLAHLQKIHLAIFKDIYPFAGKIRTEVISKGNTMFAFPQYIVNSSNKLFKQLRSEDYLAGKDTKEFVSRATYYMTEINIIHPFREGNGRTNREFIRTLGKKCGFDIDWGRVSHKELLDASIESVYNSEFLEELIMYTLRDDRVYERK
jgi:cell filamentation protein